MLSQVLPEYMKRDEAYALITGASSGIGWHISEAMAQKGYNILAISNQTEKLDELKRKLEKKYKVTVVTFNTDLAQENAAHGIFAFCEKNGLEVDVLVNNAGILVFGEVIQISYSEAKNILNLHMTTPALLCRLFAETMAKKRKGYILNVSSISAVMPYPGISFYGPTKIFLRSFTRAIRTELKLYGIHVTCLIPGATITALYKTHSSNRPLLRKTGIIKKPETVAKAGLNALFRNQAECIPGIFNKLIVFLLPLIPHGVIALIHRESNLVKAGKPDH